MLENLEAYFKGAWQFEREIIFSDSGMQYARAKGEATFEKSAIIESELTYRENGKIVMRDAGKETTFFRSYRYVFHTGYLDIFFHDELTQNFSLYQSYTFEKQSHSLIAKDKHLCNKDVYEGKFLLNNAHHFIHTTLIKGPHKDYLITTHFNRT
jgi:hypothetical protein